MISGDQVLSTAGGTGLKIGQGGGNATFGFAIADNGGLTSNWSPTGAAGTSSTQNAQSGFATLASGSQTYTLTNSYVTANSQVYTSLQAAAAGVAAIIPTTVSAGSVVFTSINGTGVATNTTANLKFAWWIVN